MVSAIVMRSTPGRPQPYTHSWEIVRNDTAHLIGGSLDCPWRWRTQHCSTTSSVVGRTPSDPHWCRGDTQAAPQNGRAKGLAQGGGVEEDAQPARVYLTGTSIHSCRWQRVDIFKCFIHQTICPRLAHSKVWIVGRNKQDFLTYSCWFILFQVFENVSHWESW